MAQENLIREVDEELRRDRMRELWRRYAPLVIGVAIAVVLAVAANELWSWYQNSNAASSSDRLYAALDAAEAGDIAGAQAALTEVVATGSGNYPLLARFKQAALLAQQGNSAEAVTAYDALANSAPDARVRELALVLGALAMVDTGTLADVEGRVGSLNTPESPLRNAAREALGLAQFRAGDLLAARTTFQSVIDDPLAAPDLIERMRIYVAQLIAMGAQTPEEQAAIAQTAQAAELPAAVEPIDPAVTDLALPNAGGASVISGWLPEAVDLPDLRAAASAPEGGTAGMPGLSPWVTGALPGQTAVAPAEPAADLGVLDLPADLTAAPVPAASGLSPWVTGPLP